jgi:hypothetical protein
MSIGIGSTEWMRFDAAGQVGIGTTNPAQLLELYSAGSTYLQMTNADTGAGGSNGFLMGIHDTAEDVLFLNYENTSLRFYTNDTERMRVSSSGEVGIGTTTPTAQLHVVGSTGITIENTSTTNIQLLFRGNGIDNWRIGQNLQVTGGTALEFYDDVNNLDRMVITNAGYVGIGTTAPGQELEVVGDAFVTSKLYIGSDASDSPWGLTTGDGMIRAAYGVNTNFTVANDYAGGYSNIYLNKIDSGADVQNSSNRVVAFYIDGVQNSAIGVNSSGDLGVNMITGGDFIIDGGNVGIGKTDPVHNLSIATTATTGPILELQFDLDSNIVADDLLGAIYFTGNDANINGAGGAQADNSSIGAIIKGVADAG